MEDIETIESRAPNDVDVVTLYHLPAGTTQAALAGAHPHLFLPPTTKANYSVDGYFVELSAGLPELIVNQAAYWYSVWSHRRSDVWKGYLQIDLGPSENAAAKAELANATTSLGGGP